MRDHRLLPATPRAADGAPARVMPRWWTNLLASGPRAVEDWWAQGQPMPIADPVREVAGVRQCEVTFVAEAPASHEVSLHLRGLTGGPRDGMAPAILQPVAGSRLHAISLSLCADGIHSYRLVQAPVLERQAVRERSAWRTLHVAGHADPRNPATLRDSFGVEASVWSGPEAPVSPGWEANGGRDEFHQLTLPCDDGASRRLWLHRQEPSWAAPHGSRKVLVLFDGAVWRGLGLLEALQANRAGLPDGQVPDLVLIDSVNHERRARDLPDPARSCSLVEQALAVAATHWGRRIEARQVILCGQSFGGLATANVVATRPDLAAHAIVQSGSFWWTPDNTQPGRAGASALGSFTDLLDEMGDLSRTRWVVQAGTDEGSMDVAALAVVERLGEHAAPVHFEHWRGGHDHAWWRHGLVAALERLATRDRFLDG